MDRVLVVSGRATDTSHFVEQISSFLYDNFSLIVAQPLEEEAGIDEMVRCIGFVVGDEVGVLTMDNQAMNINSSGIYRAVVYDDMDKAIEDAKKRLNFETGEADMRERADRIQDIVHRFTPLNSDEVEFCSMFDSLFVTNKVGFIRGLLNDEPVCLLTMQSQSEDEKELKISVLGVLLTTPELREMIETPFSRIGG